PTPLGLLGWAGILILVSAPFVALGAARSERLPAKRGLEVAGFTAMGLSSLLIVFALAGDVLHVRAWLGVAGFRLTVGGGAPLAALSAPLGKYFVTGNHEYYWDAAGWVRELELLGFSPLVNAHRVLRRGSGRVLLAGVADLSAPGGGPGPASDPAAAIAGAPESDVRVLLAHQPKSAFAALAAGFHLQLSGHTHG